MLTALGGRPGAPAVCSPVTPGQGKPGPVRPVGPPCDRCDGNHRTAACPHFRGDRDDHEDARDNLDRGGSEDADAPPVIVRGRVVPQPGDGSCLFHSLAYALDAEHSALRALVTRFLESNPDTMVAGSPVRKWVHWDCGLEPRAYAARMRTPGAWGGALEMAIIAQLKGLVVHVYERESRSEYRRIATFGAADDADAREAHVLYGGRVHYDALDVFH
jgi:hypothetical protein